MTKGIFPKSLKKIKELLQGNSDAITNLAGAGRTTETVKGIADALNEHMADTANEINELQSQVSGLASGAPKAASTVAEMTDTTKVYVYTGSEEGYTAGNWYYHNGSAWVSGGVYQATVISETDPMIASINSRFTGKPVALNYKNYYYVDSSDGSIVSASAGNFIAEYWGVTPGEIYMYSCTIGNPVRAIYALYDTSGALISTKPAQLGVARQETVNIVIPEDCVFMRVTAQNGVGTLYKIAPTIENSENYKITKGYKVTTADGYANQNVIYAGYDTVPFDGVITKFGITVNQDGLIDLYRCRRNGSSWYFNGWIGSYPVTAGANTINCWAPVKKDEYILVYDNNSCKVGYNTISVLHQPGIAFANSPLFKNPLSLTGNLSGALCFNYEVTAFGNSEVTNRLTNAPKGALFNLSSIDDSIIDKSVGWAWDGSSQTANAYLFFNKKTWCVDFIDRIMFTLQSGNTNCVFDVVQPGGGFFVRCDMTNKTLSIHKPWDGDVEDAAPDVLATKTWITDELAVIADRKYILEVHVEVPNKITATLTDSVTLDSISATHSVTGDSTVYGVGQFPMGIILRSGYIWVRNMSVYTTMLMSPLLQIYGDSYSAGYNLIRYGESHEDCWSFMLKEYLNGNVAINARGGCSTVDAVDLVETDMAQFRPKYAVIELGINEELTDGNTVAFYRYKANITKMVEAIRKAGGEPILVTVPRINGAGIGSSINSFIKNYFLGIRYYDMGAVLCIDDINYVPDYTQDPSWYLADGHPSVVGNQRMFDRFLLDFGDIGASH